MRANRPRSDKYAENSVSRFSMNAELYSFRKFLQNQRQENYFFICRDLIKNAVPDAFGNYERSRNNGRRNRNGCCNNVSCNIQNIVNKIR